MIFRLQNTKHIKGGESHEVPLFPQIRTLLQDALKDAPKVELLIFQTVLTLTNLRWGLTRIIENAGVPVWKKLFQNLRASRATELANSYPAAQIRSWMGNLPSNIETEPSKALANSAKIMGHSPKVSTQHYQMNMTENLQRALSDQNLRIDSSALNYDGAKSGAIVGRKVGTHCDASYGIMSQINPHLVLNEALMPSDAIGCEMLQGNEMPRVGIEPTTS